jgi:hypothetical protein
VDARIAQQRFTTGGEFCRRSFEVFAKCEPGEIIEVDLRST